MRALAPLLLISLLVPGSAAAAPRRCPAMVVRGFGSCLGLAAGALRACTLRRVTVFFLREAAERIAALGSEAEAPALRARLLALSEQLEEQARLLEQGGP